MGAASVEDEPVEAGASDGKTKITLVEGEGRLTGASMVVSEGAEACSERVVGAGAGADAAEVGTGAGALMMVERPGVGAAVEGSGAGVGVGEAEEAARVDTEAVVGWVELQSTFHEQSSRYRCLKERLTMLPSWLHW